MKIETGDRKRPDDAPTGEARRERMNDIASLLDRCFNGPDEGPSRKTGFALMAFPFGCEAAGQIDFASNANREHVILMIKETLLRLEGGHER